MKCEHREVLTIDTFWQCLHCNLVVYGWKGEKVEPTTTDGDNGKS